MITLVADENKIHARYENDEFVCGEKIYLPDNADLTQWKQFNDEQQARKYFGVVDENMTNEEMLIGLGVQPNEVIE